MNWYLIQTKPKAHSTASENLKRQGFSIFLPLIIKTTKKNGKFLNVKAPLFPGYLFMGSELDPVPWKTINGTRGVSTAVTLDGVYRSLDTHIIEGLQNRCNDCGVIQSLSDIIPKDRAKIERGPFADYICTVEQIKDDKRAWVLIEILQQQTITEVSLSAISKIT